jgi:hypothetical protein
LNEVVLIGGVADIRKIEELGYIDSISGRLINIYSEKDNILAYLLRIIKLMVKPCGLNKI